MEEEEIIELTDEVIEASIQPPEVEDNKEIEVQFSEPIDDDLASSIGIDDALEKEIIGDQDMMADSFAGSLGVDLEPEIDALEDIHEDVSLSPEHFEETLERVVKKMFSEKIEKMLAEMIEAAVSKEITSLKKKLFEELNNS